MAATVSLTFVTSEDNMTFPESTPAPVLGQHTEEICHELLGMTDAEIRELMAENILEASALEKDVGEING